MSERARPVVTRVARADRGENRFRGHGVLADLVGRESLAGMLGLAVAGRRLAPDERALLDDLGAILTVADPRIWPLKLARVVASYGRTLPALAAGFLPLEDARIGPWVCGAAARWLLALRGDADDAAEVDAPLLRARVAARAGRRLPGFGVAFRDRDERVDAVRAALRARGRHELPWAVWLERVIDAVRELRGLEPNVGVAVAAAGLDLGLTPQQIAVLATALVQFAFLANATEAALEPSPALRALPTRHVRYEGPGPRASPRATGQPDGF